ncbi:hypothetical protein LCGC14_1676760 [marine sediment metagenome]|uniref:Uncharacterized protein n=1 Tax=marine sediment metagenome TaxID=412755 RepID=A0A0F9HPV7_9ZZZZ
MKATTKSLKTKFKNLEQDKDKIFSNVKRLQKTCKVVKKFNSNLDSTINIMEVLFLVFKELIENMNEDKKHFLDKLKMYNEMGDALGDYLKELVQASRDIDKDNDEANTNALINASKFIKKGIRPLDRAIELIKNQRKKSKQIGKKFI